MMKLLFYIHGITGGGAERVLVTLANEFSRRGENVFIATDTNSDFAYHIECNVNLINLYDNILLKNNALIKRLYNAIQLRKNIRSIAKSIKPDIIIAFMAGMGCRVIVSTLGLGIPVIVSEHTNVSRKFGPFFNIKRSILYPFANAITLLTRYDKKIWKNKFRNLVYMPNPIKLKSYETKHNSRKKVVLAVGRVNQWYLKGFDNLLSCWSKLWYLFPDWELIIVGDANDNSILELKTHARRLECSNYKFIGFKRNIDEIMSKSEVFCLSSRIEGLPMVLIEAMNAGCCCVSFDVVTGPREIIQHNKSGLLALNQNNEDLLEKLRLVMSNDILRKSLAANAPTSVEKYSLEHIINRWYILFNRIKRNS